MSGIVAIIFFAGSSLGLAYGIGARHVKNDSDVMKAMGKAMETLGSTWCSSSSPRSSSRSSTGPTSG
jgi:p-aminobenzoyl-glutamate transporter AbgT